jgi:hypothetical protein
MGAVLVVARTPTPLSQSAFPGLIDEAFKAEGAPLRGLQRMMLAVLASIETARGRAMQNHNLGNITAGPSYPGAVWRPPWFDPSEAAGNPRLERLHQEMLAGRAPSAFRAYDSREDGARDFARQLKSSFPEVMRAALVPNAENFRAALAQKYSPDYRNPGTAAALAQLMKEYGITTGGAVSGLAALALLWLAWRLIRN